MNFNGNDRHIKRISLPKNNQNISNGFECVAIGWGEIENRTLSRVLLKVCLPIFYHDICKNKLEHIYPISDGMICARGQSGRNICVGDSGSLLRYNVKEKWVRLGITSWGIDCHISPPGYSVVYACVPYFVKWIRKTTKKN